MGFIDPGINLQAESSSPVHLIHYHPHRPESSVSRLLFVNSSTPCWPAGQASHFALILNSFQSLNLFSESPKLLFLPHPFLPSHYTVTSGPGVHNVLSNYSNHLSPGSLTQYFVLCLELDYSSLLWASSFSRCLSKNAFSVSFLALPISMLSSWFLC